MTELEMLQLAARAGGLRIDWTKKKGEYFAIRDTPYFWNAGVNVKQAFELADHLRAMVDITDERIRVIVGRMAHVVEIAYDSTHPRMAINCLAIVMVASQMQRAKEADR